MEVKTRQNTDFGYPEEAVGERKQSHIAETAEIFIDEYRYDCEIRFDILAIVWKQSGSPQITHFKDAFFPYA